MKNPWRKAILIDSERICVNLKSLTFSVPDWQAHLPGQHYDIRLTSPDGYQAARAYSIASPPEQTGEVEFGIELLEDGEVSPYLWQLRRGDQVEIRGPLGGHFVWSSAHAGGLVFLAGGSGAVPMMSMLRHRRNTGDTGRMTACLVSARSIDRLPYQQELDGLLEQEKSLRLAFTLTREIPDGWKGYGRRIDAKMLKELLSGTPSEDLEIFICGPTAFVESAAGIMTDIGYPPGIIRTERFGG